jgi:hypothetical protein
LPQFPIFGEGDDHPRLPEGRQRDQPFLNLQLGFLRRPADDVNRKVGRSAVNDALRVERAARGTAVKGAGCTTTY